MLTSLRGYLIGAMLFASLCLTTVSATAPASGFPIRDEGKFFSPQAIDQAQKRIAEIKRDFKKDLLVETFVHPPANRKKEYQSLLQNEKDKGKEKFFAAWARERYNQNGVHGVSILICKDPTYLYVEEGKLTETKAFTSANAKRTRDILVEEFKKQDFDRGLLRAVEYVGDTFKTNPGQSPQRSTTGKLSEADDPLAPLPDDKQGTANTPSLPQNVESVLGGGNSMFGWICLGLGVLLVLWIVVGLFRALTGAGQPRGGYGPREYPPPGGRPQGNYGPGAPPPGYIPPPGYGGTAGGGGGFVRSLLGGMLGGAAGMWAYDQFFRGGSSGGGGFSGGGMTSPAYGGSTTPMPDDSAGSGGAGGDWGTSGDAGGGGDWGDSSGGDSGGGDWGDSGGGGDWGGGGGYGGGDW